MTIAVITIGVFEIFAGNLTVGALVAFQILAGRVTGPLVQITALINEFQEVLLSVRMLGNVMNAASEPGMARGARPPISGKISFEDVSFTYGAATVPALDRVSFAIEPGQVIGVVGRSGSGKSTLIRLLQGLYTAQSGLIRIDDYDIRVLDKVHTRRHMAVVLPESFLFRGTIRDNIAMGRPGASESEIRAAARAAYAHDFILAFPRGYDTPVGEHGAQLAGGERQRIAIARALLKDAAIILLDEATASLDSESERQVQRALEHLCRGRTTIVIAHRLHTVVDADRIFVIEDGSVVESGRHEELLRKGGRYASFYRLQLRDQEPSPRMAIASTA